ncbi:hypothetical protein RND81_12G148000 [Saponaria officinalis]|uniref:Uncharacterized protein n=1 Tax=Saponaria officinalis TaxID=3572 RepID=A0AAW1HAS5_SAPOF
MANTKKLKYILIITVVLTLTLISTVESTQNTGESENVEKESNADRRGLTDIGFGALGKDRVPCSKRGLSFHECEVGAAANPFHRGCSDASGCARTGGGR